MEPLVPAALVAVAANVVIHPHSVDLYRQLFVDAFGLKRDYSLRGDRRALIARLTDSFAHRGYDAPLVNGDIATFLDIDLKAPWLDRVTLQQAGDEVTSEVNIPEQLRANMARFEFFFDPTSHVIVAQYETEIRGEKIRPARLSAGLLAKFLVRVFSQPEIVEKYGTVEVTPIPDRRTVEAILSSPRLRKLTIIIKPPNPDDLEEFAEVISDRIRSQNAASLTESLTARRNGSLEPDEETKRLARVGAMNGRVDAQMAGGDGGPIKVSTAQTPASFSGAYDPATESTRTGLGRATAEAVAQVIETRNMVAVLDVPAGPPPELPPEEFSA